MGYLIIVAETEVNQYPNYWADYSSNKKEALKKARGMLCFPLRGYNRCEGERPIKIIVAKEIKTLEAKELGLI